MSLLYILFGRELRGRARQVAAESLDGRSQVYSSKQLRRKVRGVLLKTVGQMDGCRELRRLEPGVYMKRAEVKGPHLA